jgi:hypothetical protein
MLDAARTTRALLMAVFVGGTIGAAALSIFDPDLRAINLGTDALWWFPVLGSVLFLAPGVVVLLRSDWHPVGWLLVNLGFGFLFSFGPEVVPVQDLSTIETWWLWLAGTSVSAVFWTVWTALILVFPDRLSSRTGGHRRLAWSVLGIDAACVVLTAFRTTLAPGVDGGPPSPMPLAIVPDGVAGVAALLPNVLLLLAIGDFVVRYRRAKEPVRSQYRWVVWAFLFEVVALTSAIVVSAITGDPQHPVWLVAVVGYLLVPVSFTVAILRYRLYDIDRIVSRTVTYATVAVLVGAVYTVPVLLLPNALGESNDLLVAGSTLAAAALFNPARRRISAMVDRRFNRSRFDAEREVAVLSSELGSVATLSAVAESLSGVLSRTVQPDSMTLWIRKP